MTGVGRPAGGKKGCLVVVPSLGELRFLFFLYFLAPYNACVFLRGGEKACGLCAASVSKKETHHTWGVEMLSSIHT